MRKGRRETWAKWHGLIAEQKQSGQSVAAFCRERGLCAPHFFAWKKRLSEEATNPFVAVEVVSAGQRAPSRAVEIRLAGGRRVMVEPGFDAAHLRAVVEALEARP
jgi:transposase-like protein